MNQAEKKAYQSLRRVPKKLRERSASEPMYQASKERFEAEKDAMARANAQTASVYDILRSLVQTSPQTAALRTSLPSSPKRPVEPTFPKFAAIPTPKSPNCRLRPRKFLQVTDLPPFLTDLWYQEWGPNDVQTNADPSGELSFLIYAGWDPTTRQTSSGQATCWVGAGQDYSPPTGGTLTFKVVTSYSWRADWSSNLWRLAAGNIWIGQFISRYDQNVNFIDQPVATQTALYSFHDNNFSDKGDQSGAISGILLQCQLDVDPAYIYRCFLWAGGSANATPTGEADSSTAQISLRAGFSSIMLEL